MEQVEITRASEVKVRNPEGKIPPPQSICQESAPVLDKIMKKA